MIIINRILCRKVYNIDLCADNLIEWSLNRKSAVMFTRDC